MIYLDISELLLIAEKINGTAHCVRDWGLLQSAAERPKSSVFGVDAYPTLLEKVAALLHSIARNHALVDGNKRTAWIAADIMLVLNQGSGLRTDTDRQEEFMNRVAEGELEVPEIAAQLKRWT
ncbi:type II toxin-antitoxin system death-on-curing family toxin [Nocardia cyriacigeorgica]|uniref:type II toxin-antitoxin system death-on-curing family toxin n=1 Tax=Nocardia cyriacigeorgica TaxID=135487 RepID=UPI0018950FCE|nr:type II toxin-antitoxin system death-on-curing family toxin [Nocardia cyriacigeorgica]MBF6087668.1 type II toxin-antitoxin system death-on-curing family toxin [Nocardia cyriacigeorgica]MBF6092401.1 type II toxin-antitoxin system death-on-curing family toxin [Nocardia cyriacigeorgica]MBF6396977.1 type II toxin-antitoxin system death-on-curing family toxin [Nocardia cyriacigeorgica]MBF6403365.1 type II toxin-antitoxin system death-on-curing family toxin [Nocardia cyriacigeorgica]